MRGVVGRDKDGLHAGIRQARVKIVVGMPGAGAVISSEPLGFFAIAAHQGNKVCRLAVAKRGQDGLLGNVSQSHDGITDSFGLFHPPTLQPGVFFRTTNPPVIVTSPPRAGSLSQP
jgi:hypothetical protein